MKKSEGIGERSYSQKKKNCLVFLSYKSFTAAMLMVKNANKFAIHSPQTILSPRDEILTSRRRVAGCKDTVVCDYIKCVVYSKVLTLGIIKIVGTSLDAPLGLLLGLCNVPTRVFDEFEIDV